MNAAPIYLRGCVKNCQWFSKSLGIPVENKTVWIIADHARSVFQDHVPFWAMQPQDHLVDQEGAYVFAKTGDVYVVYLPQLRPATIDLTDVSGSFQLD